MKYSLNHLLLLVLIAVVLIQGVQVFVDWTELRRLKRFAVEEELIATGSERGTRNIEFRSQVFRSIMANYQAPTNFDAAAKRFRNVRRNDDIE